MKSSPGHWTIVVSTHLATSWHSALSMALALATTGATVDMMLGGTAPLFLSELGRGHGFEPTVEARREQLGIPGLNALLSACTDAKVNIWYCGTSAALQGIDRDLPAHIQPISWVQMAQRMAASVQVVSF